MKEGDPMKKSIIAQVEFKIVELIVAMEPERIKEPKAELYQAK
jgi:hypothetical protein